jgi:hypothetical protein
VRFLHFLGERRPESLADRQQWAEADPRNRNSSPSGQKVPKGVAGEALRGRKPK